MPNGPNGKFRHRKANFAQISNSALQDKRLSLKAKGLYSLIQSYLTIPNYDLYKWSLIKQCKEGEKAVDSAWKELKDCGYLKQYRIPSGERGRFCYEYELLDIADNTNPAMVNLNRYGEVAPSKKEEFDHTPQKGVYGQMEDSAPDHTPHLAPYAQSTTCSEHPMLNGGCNNNTQSNNTQLNNIESVSQSKADGQSDHIRESLKAQIEYEYFADNTPEDVPGILALLDCMADMLLNPQTKISGVEQSREALRPLIGRVDSCAIREFIDHMKGKQLAGVVNVRSYWQTALINFLREQELLKLQI